MFPEGWGTTKCSSDLVHMITPDELALLHTTDTTAISLNIQMGQNPSLTPCSKNENPGSCQFLTHISVAGNTWPIMLQNALVRINAERSFSKRLWVQKWYPEQPPSSVSSMKNLSSLLQKPMHF